MSISHITNAYKCWIRHELCCFLQACLTWSSFGLSQSPSWSVAVLVSHGCFLSAMTWHPATLPFDHPMHMWCQGLRRISSDWQHSEQIRGDVYRKYVHLSLPYCMCIYLSVYPKHKTLNGVYIYVHIYIYIYMYSIYIYIYTLHIWVNYHVSLNWSRADLG